MDASMQPALGLHAGSLDEQQCSEANGHAEPQQPAAGGQPAGTEGLQEVLIALEVQPASQRVQLSIEPQQAEQAHQQLGADAEASAPSDASMPLAELPAPEAAATANGLGTAAAAAAEANGQPAEAGGAPSGVDALHEEILRFAEEAAPTPEEAARKEAALAVITEACRAALGGNKRLRVQLFGSGAHGIALRGCDLDVVITHFITPLQTSGAFTTEQKENVNTSLKRISDALMRKRAVAQRPFIIYNARVPVAKVDMCNGVRADISIGSEDGPRAAAFLREWQGRFPMLRPLCMAVKALLLDAGLHEVGRGGLSSWSSALMAVALLQEQEKAGCGTDCAGHLLLGFLKYYGRIFDYATQAVSVRQGGIVPKGDVPQAGGKAAASAAANPAQMAQVQQRLCVEDPVTGRDVANGSHSIQAVAQAFRDAASKLELLLKSPDPPPGGYLPAILNVQAILEGRPGGGQRERAEAGGGAAVVGTKRPRDGGAAAGPRKGGPGPRPMLKQSGAAVRPYSVPAAMHVGGGGGGGGSGLALMQQQQQPQQQQQQVMPAPAAAAVAQPVAGLQGTYLLPGGGMLVQSVPSMQGMQGMTAVMLPMQAQQTQQLAPQQQIYVQQQAPGLVAQQPQLAQFVGSGGAGGLVVLAGGGLQAPQLGMGGAGMQQGYVQLASQGVGMALPLQQQPQQQSVQVLTPMGLQHVVVSGQQGGTATLQQAAPGMVGQQVFYHQQGGYMQ